MYVDKHTKLDAGGALVYSTYLGGSGGGEVGYGIAVDGAGNAYVTGETHSADFPTRNAFQGNFGGGVDAFITKLDAGGALVYSTYLGGSVGGSAYDAGEGIAVDGAGNAYVTGLTYSIDFPTRNAFQGSFRGYVDAFVTKISAGDAPPLSATLGAPSVTNPAGTAAEPVNTATGNYYYQTTDLSIPGRGLPFTFQRTYNSQDAYSGPLGYGWTHAYNVLLTPNANGSVTIKQGDGHEEFYDPNGDGTYRSRYPASTTPWSRTPTGRSPSPPRTRPSTSFVPRAG